jgi:hypothetical protein
MSYESELQRLQRLLQADYNAYLDELDKPWSIPAHGGAASAIAAPRWFYAVGASGEALGFADAAADPAPGVTRTSAALTIARNSSCSRAAHGLHQR